MAAQVSMFDHALNGIENKALSLFVLSFSRYPRVAECRNGMISIAEFFRDQREVLRDLNGQSLALLVNGFSKWPEHENAREATVAIAVEIRHHADRLSGFEPQNLANLVNGFSKWPEDCHAAINAIAGEIRHRAGRPDRLSDHTSQNLANLVNGFSKRPEGAQCRGAVVAIAREVCLRADRLSRFLPQELSNLVNGFSKWPREAKCEDAVAAIARETADRADRLSAFIPQDLTNLLNGFSKRPQMGDCRRAAVVIATEVIRRADRGVLKNAFIPQHLANLVNGFSKWPDMGDCGRAAVVIATEVIRRADRGALKNAFIPQHLANLVNGFSKWPQTWDCGRAVVVMATEIIRRADCGALTNDFSPQEFGNLVNGFSKWPQTVECHRAAAAIAKELTGRRGRLSQFSPQGLAILVNGFSKWPDSCRDGIVSIATEVSHRADRLCGFDPQGLANLANGFSKWPDETCCGEALLVIADEIFRRAEQLTEFDQQGLANLANGFSKWPEQAGCGEAIVAIAGEVLRRTEELADFSSQHLANLVNGFSKWPQEEDTRRASIAIVGEVLRRADRIADFTPQGLANLMNGFSKWPEEAACHQAIVEIARQLGAGGQRFGAFTTPQLCVIANVLARHVTQGEDLGEIAETGLVKDRLHQLAHYLQYADDRLGQADALSVATLLKALAKAQLFDDLSFLARAGLERLTVLLRAPDFVININLETMGNLCAALLPLARSPQKQLHWHRRQALGLLNDIQPVVERKIEAHLRASNAERIRGPASSRCPALSIYQALKVRVNLEALYRRPHVVGVKSDLRLRQQELRRKTKEILVSTRDLIEGDLSNMSWNVIAEIEAESPVDALDTFMARNATAVQAQHPASVFDVYQVLRAMDQEPRPPEGEAGLMRLPVVDMQGRRIATEPETRYSVFHRLTSGALPVVAVQLPGMPSAFMLARTLTVEGVPYRMDLFGGSKLKPPNPTVSQVAARPPGAETAMRGGGKLLAIPYAETAPGTAFEQLARAWAPFKEAYYYTQRRGFAAPPAINGLGPHDYALEGAFKLSLLPDRRATEAHPFRLTGPQGSIALRPHDGCGFIKASLAERMQAVRRAGPQQGPDRLPAFGERRRCSIPASALQHYPRSELVADEVRKTATKWLETRQGRELTSEELFRTVTAGHIDGPGAVAVPSSDDCLHVPTLKSETLTGTSGVLIGRAPYDKPNLRPFAAEQVRSAVDRDPTAVFLDSCTAIQYSFNVAQKSGQELTADDPIFFAKGILIVVPDKMWPAEFAERGLVMSAEDVKCHSNWTQSKDRVKVDTPVDCVGILQATEVFAPGSLVAVPTGEQNKLDGDFDGDTVVIVGDRPQLYEHVRAFDQKEQARGLRSLKPPKSHSPAIAADGYQFSRGRQILSATQNTLETYSCLQRSFLAQSHEGRRWFAERAIFGTYEGIHHELGREIARLLGQEQVSSGDILNTLARARDEVEIAKNPVARELAELLVADLVAWAARPDPQLQTDTVEGVSGAKLTVSPRFCELFPELAETYTATPQPRDRVQLLLDHYPPRIHPHPDGYNPDDLVQSANNLLSLGIKVGTDAYKSDTGARLFMKKSGTLMQLLSQAPGLRSVPYVKNIAAHLKHGTLCVEATLEDLKNNPTLAASVMEASLKLATEEGILPAPSGRRSALEDSAMMITLSREEALERATIEAARARAEESKITEAALRVAASLRTADIQVNTPHLEHRLRSKASMTDQLTGMSIRSCDAQLIKNAVRHVFEVPDKDFTRAFKKAMLAFDELGYAEISTTNWFRVRTPTFIGIKTVLTTPDKYRFEVEFHTPGSYRAKLVNHDAYKKQDALRQEAGADALRRAEELAQHTREVCSNVAIPDDAVGIPHWGIEENRGGSAATAFGLQAVAQPRMPQIASSTEAREIVAAIGMRPVVLIGMPCAGKSTIGDAFAKRLRLPFVDTDKKIKERTGKKISQIFEVEGEEYFRKLEADVIADLLKTTEPVVIATGGGAILHEQSRCLIGKKALSIWLNTRLEVIEKRLKHDTSRPLLQGPNRKQKIAQLFRERKPFYEQADFTFAPSHKQDKKNADLCLTALHAHLHGEAVAAEQASSTNGVRHNIVFP
ncbi:MULTISPECIES: XopAD/skwp family type III secretion system effector [unclassified Sinorhizobium]|uniref:XopAD/skwp family type III secretion system effector n=1 Tax=unclassified Sinorhizobium TaxID=2613772 RepID=UPI0024C284E0|nr:MULTISPECIES: XopAD/skwp family type III secretion system effector [unclassified Sinorhizobium]MDK1378227.1 XopAD/skwp family type III secretion system effector [Sinorhizobium sp. 6-70]MDK1480390.1 XopAD/skwp family type III secretion system effector [Sinorhizobium sp. 6-117]